MNKRLLCFIFFILILSPPIAMAETAAESGGINLLCDFIEGKAAANYYTAAVDYSQTLYAVIAAYDDDILLKVKIKEFKPETGQPDGTSVIIDNIPTADEVKAFLWEADKLSPLAAKSSNDPINWEYADIYVSTEGNDSNDGSAFAPYKTIQKAVSKARTLNPNRDITVSIAGGRYEIKTPISFSFLDSGKNSNKIIYKGAENLSTVISGGQQLGGFTSVPDTPYYETDFASENFIYEFYINNHRAKPASSEYKYQPKDIYDDPQTPEALDGFIFDNLPYDFENCDGMFMANAFEWKYSMAPISDFFTLDGMKIATGIQPYSTWYPEFLKVEYPVYFINHISLLDRPGEFYYDKENSKLYYYPFENEDMGNAIGYIPVSEGLISINGSNNSNKVKNLSFENITFKHGLWKLPWEIGYSSNQAENYAVDPAITAGEHDWMKGWDYIAPAQFKASYADNIELKNSKFENLSAVAAGFTDGVTNSEIYGNSFYDIGAAAVTIGRGSHINWYNSGDLKLCKYIDVNNNFIRETGQIYQSSPAITAYYVNNCKINNNDIENVPYSGISLGWGWGNSEPLCSYNEIAYNRIVNVMGALWDGSHIYTLSEMPNTVIHDNYMSRTDNSFGGGGVYPDEGSAGLSIYNNLTENARSWNIDWGRRNITYSNNYVEFLKEKITAANGFNEIDNTQRAGFTVYSSHSPQTLGIINNAGLEPEYQHIKDDFHEKPENIFSSDLEWYFSDNSFVVRAGEMLTEPGTYYDGSDWNEFDGLGNGTDWGGRRLAIGYGGSPEWVTYKITVQNSGFYNLYTRTGTDAKHSKCTIYLNNILAASRVPLNVKAMGNVWTECQTTYLTTIYLEAGVENLLKYEYADGYWNFDSLVFEPIADPDPFYAAESFNYNIGGNEIAFKNFPEANESNVNGGEGWKSKWSKNKPTDSGYPLDFLDDNIPGFYPWSDRTVAFSYSSYNLYREFENPIYMLKNKTIRLKYDIMSQFSDRNGLMLGSIFIGSQRLNDSKMRPTVRVDRNNLVYGAKELDIGNSYWYTYLAELTINAVGQDKIRLKVFPRGDPEPILWDGELNVELGGAPITYAGFEIGASSYFSDLQIYEVLAANPG